MVVPTTPLKLLALYEHADLAPSGDLDQQKREFRTGLANCDVTIAFGTYQAQAGLNGEKLDTVLQARAEALEIISIGEKMMRAQTLEEFNLYAENFRGHYVNLVNHIEHLVWLYRNELIPTVAEVM